LNQDNID